MFIPYVLTFLWGTGRKKPGAESNTLQSNLLRGQAHLRISYGTGISFQEQFDAKFEKFSEGDE